LKRITSRRVKFTIVLLIAMALDFMRPWQLLPPAWNPLEPLALNHRMNPVVRWKLAQIKADPEQCLAVLATAPQGTLDYLPLKDYTPVENCPLSNVVRVTGTQLEFNAPFTLSCPLLVRWVMFEQQQLQPLALTHKGSNITAIDHFGTFACRNVYNREAGRRSQHATASAFDVAAFHFENGSMVSVLNDWDNEKNPANSVFLHEVHDAACSYFGTVLGPDYNQPHANHFHLDTSNFNLCR
jgi:hypothetical protein